MNAQKESSTQTPAATTQPKSTLLPPTSPLTVPESFTPPVPLVFSVGTTDPKTLPFKKRSKYILKPQQ